MVDKLMIVACATVSAFLTFAVHNHFKNTEIVKTNQSVKNTEYHNVEAQILIAQEKVNIVTHKINQQNKNLDTILGKVYKITSHLNLSKKEEECLAKNIFYEAGVGTLKAKLAVAQITLNRKKTGKWGKTICEVVYSKAQFSWTLEKKKKYKTPKGELWDKSKHAAKEFIHGARIHGLADSLHYRADYIDEPKWAVAKNEIMQIGQHIFYSN